ncbi:TetR/AcrR family transcriptional regulator C-terminal domain-containing protein [Lacrimispora sp.]|uniref:TetR/AcrR family transcriptional regulator C-terminal domain-containing protein n=1 Tax=Lacrimispora sp. TaxID=2719234 RepID=UPI002FDB17EF
MAENPNKNDKTKYRLADSIKECMKTKNVDKITVQNIVDGCGMTRQTFYRNFKDKYDLINWYFDKLVLESFAQIGVDKTVCQSLCEKFNFIKKEKIFFAEAFRSDDYNSLKEHDFELIIGFYTDLLTRKKHGPLPDDIQFLLEMYCRGSVYMTVKWVLSGMKQSPEEMALSLTEAMPPGLAAVFTEVGLI